MWFGRVIGLASASFSRLVPADDSILTFHSTACVPFHRQRRNPLKLSAPCEPTAYLPACSRSRWQPSAPADLRGACGVRERATPVSVTEPLRVPAGRADRHLPAKVRQCLEALRRVNLQPVPYPTCPSLVKVSTT
jgi:hypothetical protein